MISAILTLIILLLSCIILFLHIKHIKMLDRLNLMLDSSITNTFSETEFTESRLSKIETERIYQSLLGGKQRFNIFRIYSETGKYVKTVSFQKNLNKNHLL